MSDVVAIAAVSEMKPGRYPQYSPERMYIEVLRQFLREWEIRPNQIDGLKTARCTMSP